ncbi:hypothetical protein PIB30_073950, partial [Stylosanthes scabra]|nr:hypothetical protein [Stylosanthes scabra]
MGSKTQPAIDEIGPHRITENHLDVQEKFQNQEMQVMLMKARALLAKDKETKAIGRIVVNEDSFSVEQDQINLENLMKIATEINSAPIDVALTNLIRTRDKAEGLQLNEGRELVRNEGNKTNEYKAAEIKLMVTCEENKLMQIAEDPGREVPNDKKGKGIMIMDTGSERPIKKYKPKPVIEYYMEIPEDSDEDDQKEDNMMRRLLTIISCLKGYPHQHFFHTFA